MILHYKMSQAWRHKIVKYVPLVVITYSTIKSLKATIVTQHTLLKCTPKHETQSNFYGAIFDFYIKKSWGSRDLLSSYKLLPAHSWYSVKQEKVSVENSFLINASNPTTTQTKCTSIHFEHFCSFVIVASRHGNNIDWALIRVLYILLGENGWVSFQSLKTGGGASLGMIKYKRV